MDTRENEGDQGDRGAGTERERPIAEGYSWREEINTMQGVREEKVSTV